MFNLGYLLATPSQSTEYYHKNEWLIVATNTGYDNKKELEVLFSDFSRQTCITQREEEQRIWKSQGYKNIAIVLAKNHFKA